MRRAAVLLTVAASLACVARAEEMERTLTFPHPVEAGKSAFLEIQVGPLAPGQRVRVTTSSGAPLGAIAPFGRAERGRPGVYSLPVPPEAIRNGALSVRVTIVEANKPPRSPTAAEVQSIKLVPQDAE